MSEQGITPNWLDQQIQRASYCSTASITGDYFGALMTMAMRVNGYDSSGLPQLWAEFQYDDDVKLTGSELRALLMLAKQARGMRPQLRVVKSSNLINELL